MQNIQRSNARRARTRPALWILVAVSAALAAAAVPCGSSPGSSGPQSPKPEGGAGPGLHGGPATATSPNTGKAPCKKVEAARREDREARLARLVRVYEQLEKARAQVEALRGEVGTLTARVKQLEQTVAKLEYDLRDRDRGVAGLVQVISQDAKQYEFLSRNFRACNEALRQALHANYALRGKLKALQGKKPADATPRKAK